MRYSDRHYHIWSVVILRASYKEEYKAPYQLGLGDSAAQFVIHNVRSATRREALEKVLPQMKSEQDKLQGKYVSMWIGSRTMPSYYPGRLAPIQVVIETWTIRPPVR